MISMKCNRGSSIAVAISLGVALFLGGCNDGSGDPNAQIGANPTLPGIRQFLLPPVHIARVIGWKQGETPTPAQGLQIKALAIGLQHPRNLYVLPNGDILVIE